MENNNIQKLGGTCAILLGISYLIIGLTYLLLPETQKGGTLLHESETFLLSLSQSPTLITIHHLVSGLSALLGIAVVMGVLNFAHTLNEGWVRWMSYLGYLGFGVTAVDHFRILSIEPIRAERFVGGDLSTQSIIKTTNFFVSIDPHMWLSFGLVGVWVLVISWLLLRKKVLSRLFGYIGIAIFVLYFLVELGTVFKNELLISVSAGLGAIILAPIWYIWLGIIFRKDKGIS